MVTKKSGSKAKPKKGTKKRLAVKKEPVEVGGVSEAKPWIRLVNRGRFRDRKAE
jgi:hypothetical protein